MELITWPEKGCPYFEIFWPPYSLHLFMYGYVVGGVRELRPVFPPEIGEGLIVTLD